MTDMIKDRIEPLNFTQIIQKHTRSWRGLDDSLLDQIWTNTPIKIIRNWNKVRTFSDHNYIGMQLRLKGKSEKNSDILKRDRRKWNVEEYRNRISEIDWRELYSTQNIDKANTLFEDNVVGILNDMIPLKRTQARNKAAQWLEAETLELMRKRDLARQKARITDDDADWENFRELRNVCTEKVKNYKKNHNKEKYEKFTKDNNSRGLFSAAKRDMGWTSGGPPTCFIIDGNIVEGHKNIANIQVRHYTKKIKNLIDKLPNLAGDPLSALKTAVTNWGPKWNRVKKLTIQPTGIEQVKEVIKNIGNGTAFGRDYIDSNSIKAAGDLLCGPINHIINISIDQCKFPMKWKTARIIPLHKGEGAVRSSPEGFRPIALLPILSKICEHVIQYQIMRHMNNNHMWNRNNNAYRGDHSTTTALIQLTDLMLESADRREVGNITAIDQSAAFDSIRHDVLLAKLEVYKLQSTEPDNGSRNI